MAEEEQLLWDDDEEQLEQACEQDNEQEQEQEQDPAYLDQLVDDQPDQPHEAAQPGEVQATPAEDLAQNVDATGAQANTEPVLASHAHDKPAPASGQPASASGRRAIVFDPAVVQPPKPSVPAVNGKSTSAGVFSAARNSEERSSKEGRVRYFVIKSFNQENIDIAVDIGGWSTTNDVAYRLDEAFHSGAEVRLFFSVNGSGTFSGYAVMKTAAGRFPGPPILWSNNKPFGQSFVIEWKCLYNLPYSAIEHLRNPLNEDKVVYHARGGQELPCSVGDEMVRLMEVAAQQAGVRVPPVKPPRPPGSMQGNGRGRMQDQRGGPGRSRGHEMSGEAWGSQGRVGRGGDWSQQVGSGQQGMMGGVPGMNAMAAMNPMAMMGQRNLMMAGNMVNRGMGVQGPGMDLGQNSTGSSMRGGAMGLSQGVPGSRHDMNSDVLVGEHTRHHSRSPPTSHNHYSQHSQPRERSRSPVASISALKQQHQQQQQQLMSRRTGYQDNVGGAGGGSGKGPGGKTPDLLSQSYPEYLEDYRRVQQKMEGIKEAQRAAVPVIGASAGTGMLASSAGGMGNGMRVDASLPAAMNPGMLQASMQMAAVQQQQQNLAAMQAMSMGIPHAMAAGGMMNPMLMAGMGPAAMMGGMNPMMMSAAGNMMMAGGLGAGQGMMNPMLMAAGGGMSQQQPLNEAQYVQYTIQHFRSQGELPPSEEFIRQHYRQQKQNLEMAGRMRM